MTCINCKCASCKRGRTKDKPRQLSNAVWLALLVGVSKENIAYAFGVSKVRIANRATTVEKWIYNNFLDVIKETHSSGQWSWLRRLIDAGAVRVRARDWTEYWHADQYSRRHEALPSIERMRDNDALFDDYWSETREDARARVRESIRRQCELKTEEQRWREERDAVAWSAWIEAWKQIGHEVYRWPDRHKRQGGPAWLSADIQAALDDRLVRLRRSKVGV